MRQLSEIVRTPGRPPQAGHLFQPNGWAIYCSRAPANIHCIGMLKVGARRRWRRQRVRDLGKACMADSPAAGQA